MCPKRGCEGCMGLWSSEKLNKWWRSLSLSFCSSAPDAVPSVMVSPGLCCYLISFSFLPFLGMANEFTQTLTHHVLHCIPFLFLCIRLSRWLGGKLNWNSGMQAKQCQDLLSSLKANRFVLATSMLFKCLNVWNKMGHMQLSIEYDAWPMLTPELYLADLSQKSCQGTCLWAVNCSLMLFKFTRHRLRINFLIICC